MSDKNPKVVFYVPELWLGITVVAVVVLFVWAAFSRQPPKPEKVYSVKIGPITFTRTVPVTP